MEPNSSSCSYSSIFIKLLTSILAYTTRYMGHLNVFPIVMTLVFHLSMHANEAGRILHSVEQELMNKNSVNQRAILGGASLLGMLHRGPVQPSVPNPQTHDSSPSNSQSTFVGYNLQGSLAKGPVIPSIPNPEKHIPTSIVNERAFVGYHLNSIQGSLQKGPTPRSMGDPRTYIPWSHGSSWCTNRWNKLHPFNIN